MHVDADLGLDSISGTHSELGPEAIDQLTISCSAFCTNYRVSNRSAGMISRIHFHENSAEFAVLSTFTGQGH